MQRLEDLKMNLDLNGLKSLADEYTEIHGEQIIILLDKANSQEFNSHYNRLTEIEGFRETIANVIEEVEMLICK